jgi:RecB family exonuclease
VPTTTNPGPKKPRQLFLGPFPALERELATAVATYRQQHGPLAPLTILVPTHLLGLHLQRRLAPLANVRFQTILETGLSPLAGELLCRRLARQCDGYFAPVHDTPGFATALLATFTDLQEAGLATLPGKSAKLRELAAVYEKFSILCPPSPVSRLLSPVFLYGFYDLNAIQRAFVEKLAPAAVFFPTGNEFADPLLDWFKSQGYQVSSSPISNLQFPISVVSCPGETAEVREAVRAILDYLRTHPGTTFNDCAILCRSRDQYDAILRDTLPALGVPAYFRGGRPLSEHPDAQRLRLLLEVIRTDYSRTAVMELACHIGPNSDWDALTVELGIVGGSAGWEARLHFADVGRDEPPARPLPASAPRAGEPAARPYHEPLAGFIHDLFAATAKVPGKGTWAAFVESVTAAWRQLGGTHTKVRDAVAALAELDAIESPVEFATFAEFCQKVLDAGREQTAKFQGGGLFVGDVMGARGLSFDFVVVLGLVEKSFPRLVREDPLLLDDERAAISPALPLKRRGHAEERMLFQLACQTARDQLVLSFPRLEAGTARPRVPSFLLLEATGATNFKTMPCRQVPLSAFAKHEWPVDEREFDLPVLPADDNYLAAISPLLLAGVQAERAHWRDPKLTGYDGIVPGRPLLTTSATALEKFFSCPFLYFLKHVLRLEPWEEPEAAVVIDPSDLGTLYHRILEVYYRDGGDLNVVIEDHFHQFEQHGVTGYPTVWEIKKEIVRQELAAFVAREQRRLGADWKPGKFEEEFEREISPVRLRGKIDRVDFSADGQRARIWDYKTGKAYGLKDNALAGGEALQLPLYLLAAEQLWPGVCVEEAGYLYFTLRGGYRVIHFSRATLDDRRAEVTGLLETASAMIRAGQFAQYATEEGCRHCDFRAICGNGIVKLAERKAGDPRLAAFHQIKAEVK